MIETMSWKQMQYHHDATLNGLEVLFDHPPSDEELDESPQWQEWNEKRDIDDIFKEKNV